MAILTAMLVTSALLTPVYMLAQGGKMAETGVSSYFNGLGKPRARR